MKLRQILCAACLLAQCLTISAQSWPSQIAVGSDSVVCFTPMQVDTLAVRLTQLDGCRAELAATQQVVDWQALEAATLKKVINQHEVKDEAQDSLVYKQRVNLRLQDDRIDYLEKRARRARLAAIVGIVVAALALII